MFTLLGTMMLQIADRLKALAVMVLAVIAIPLSMQDADFAQHTYLLQAEGAPSAIMGMPTEDAEYDVLHVNATENTMGDAQLVLDKGQIVTVEYQGQSQTVEARHETVANLLRRLDITPTEDEMIVLDVNGETLRVIVTDTWTFDWEKTVETGYETERVANPRLLKGTEQVIQAGQAGSYVETYRDVYAKGVVDHTDFISRTDDTAVTEIIEYGTRVESVSASARLTDATMDEQGGLLTFDNGETLSYSRMMTCEATAYCDYGTTATGYITAPGVIAVDPSVIPYGTRMYIQTPNGGWVYGMAVARDCGGAVKGNIIDLWFPDLGTCLTWGRRAVTVYILD